MPIDVLMPALSPTMERGTLIRWLKGKGDPVKAGDLLAEIETDKATMEVEAVDEGILADILVPDGTPDVPVRAVIALLTAPGEGVAAALLPPSPVESASRVVATPLARRVARDAGLPLDGIAGSGAHGRIVRRDVAEAMARVPAPVAKPPAPEPAALEPPAPPHTTPSVETFDAVPHDTMRQTIARRLTEAKATVPHFYAEIDCQLDALLALRATLNDAAPILADGGRAYRLSINDFIIKAQALALVAVPQANVRWTADALLRHRHADVAVAVSLPGGLITPVIRNADAKAVSAISNEMRNLAGRARARDLKPAEFQGGTTTLSNLGMFGVTRFTAILNPPHATILAVGAVEKRLLVRDDAPAVGRAMSVTLSVDHRAIDGAVAAEFLRAFRDLIETPLRLLA